MLHGHILRSHCVGSIFPNLILALDTNLNPLEFGWNSVDSVLMPNKMHCYTTRDMHCYLWLQEKIYLKMLVQQVWHFMHRILEVH